MTTDIQVNPSKRFRGQSQSTPDVLLRRRNTQSDNATSPLTSIAPQFIVEKAVFDAIPIASGVVAGSGGLSYFYPIRRFRIDKSTGRELLFLSAQCTMLPTDSAAAGNATIGIVGGGGVGQALGWGDTAGLSAAIVVTKNLLFLADGVWTLGQCPLAGIETNATAVNQRAVLANNYLATFYFPTGKLNDTTPNKTSEARFYGGAHVHKLSMGDILDVCLVTRGSTIASAGGIRYIVGFADLSLTFGVVKDDTALYE